MTKKIGDKRGGKREGAGRKRGAAEVAAHTDKLQLAAACREHIDEMIQTALDVMRHSESDAARMSAVSFLADRGWGRAPQALVVEDVRENSMPFAEFASSLDIIAQRKAEEAAAHRTSH